MRFQERLSVELKLTRAGEVFTVPAGNLRACALELGRSGFRASVEFVLRDDSQWNGSFQDKLAPVFLTQDELSIELSLTPEHPTPESSGAQAPLRLKGLVTGRSLEEIATKGASDDLLLFRRYLVEFVDPARARWDDHFPVALYTQRSLLSVLQEHTASAFELSSSWEKATEELPQLFLHLPRVEGVSLHDFVVWYVDRCGGCVLYDYGEGGYSLAADESSKVDAISLFGDDVARTSLRLRARDPAQPRILNSYAPSPATVSPEAEGVLSGVTSDWLIREAVLAEQSAREQLEGARRDLGGVEAEVVLRAFPPAVVAPGGNVSCKKGQRFAFGSRLLEGDWRVDRLRLSARAAGEEIDAEYDGASVGLDLEVVLDLKQSSDVQPPRARVATPRYPGSVEGLVLSEKGSESDVTWDMTQAAQTQAQEVAVHLPLFAQSISAPFEPADSFNTFRPRARGERVLVELGLHSGRVARSLSFRPEAVLQADVCGEQMVFGKSGKSITRVSHQYADDAPVFGVTRVHEKDQVQMTFSEGKVLFCVAEGES